MFTCFRQALILRSVKIEFASPILRQNLIIFSAWERGLPEGQEMENNAYTE